MQKVSRADLYMGLVDFANQVDDLRTPADVLGALHVVSTTNLPLNVLGAARFPIKAAGLETTQLGKSCFACTRAFQTAGGMNTRRSQRAISHH
jgi:hypothetical protein